jgi:hypothetical protein
MMLAVEVPPAKSHGQLRVIGIREVDINRQRRGEERTALHPRCRLLLAEGESERCR